MGLIDLYPEELLDKEQNSELDDGERERLDAFCERSEACNFERQVRGDFAEQLANVEVDDTKLDTLVAGVVAGESEAHANAERSSSGVTQSSGQRQSLPPAARRRPWRLLVAALVISSAAAAGGGYWLAAPEQETEGAPDEPGQTTNAAPGLDERPAISTSPQKPAQQDEASEDDEVAPAPEPKQPAAAGQPHSAATLFEQANRARRGGSYGSAERLYRRLQESFPGSPEARLSQVSLGRLLLDRGQAAAAVQQFDAYLSSGGSLSEQAMLGRALALGRLGRQGTEVSAWEQFIKAFPNSAHASRAHRRLTQLNAR